MQDKTSTTENCGRENSFCTCVIVPSKIKCLFNHQHTEEFIVSVLIVVSYKHSMTVFTSKHEADVLRLMFVSAGPHFLKTNNKA